MSLFESKLVTFNDVSSLFNINCDAFTDDDWMALARMVDEQLRGKYRGAVGTNVNGALFSEALNAIVTPTNKSGLPRIVCHDVWASGEVMMRVLKDDDIGICVFGRPEFKVMPPDNVIVLFSLDYKCLTFGERLGKSFQVKRK